MKTIWLISKLLAILSASVCFFVGLKFEGLTFLVYSVLFAIEELRNEK